MQQDWIMEKYSMDIREVCLQPAAQWTRPRRAETQEVLRRANMNARHASEFLGISTSSNGRQVRKWMSEEAPIPYSAWALVCAAAGLGQI
ncbi:XRE family transcriptional regulator [Burkholderia diffusa]|uniref:XRE family transcriptional regulator n=1 Tax=Burkholderia diffusa TaxID=488732 RepID=UPI000AED2348|nr:XRE family transcriptional regulator [Burkholderia diffusa]